LRFGIALLVGRIIPGALAPVGHRLGDPDQCTKTTGNANSYSFTHEHYNGLSCGQVHIVGSGCHFVASIFVTLCQPAAI
jgi:hypothetical protein